MIKIIFSDMDGTLLNSKGELPKEFDETIAELKKRGVIFAPTSGRQYFSLLQTFTKYTDEFLFLAENGTLVMYHENEIFSSPMNRDDAQKVLKVSENFGKNVLRVFSGKKNAYILKSQDTPEFKEELIKFYTRTEVVDDWEEVDDVPIKNAFFDITGHAKENIYDKLAQFYESLQVVQSSDYWTDVMSKTISKGEAIKNIQQILNIKPSECAAFGDFMNDYEMMQSVEHSFAMANALPALKKVSKYETASNDEAGVIVGIKKLMTDGLI